MNFSMIYTDPKSNKLN